MRALGRAPHVEMTGLRGLLRRAFGRDRNSRSVPDGGVVVVSDSADAGLSGDAPGDAAETETGTATSEGEEYTIGGRRRASIAPRPSPPRASSRCSTPPASRRSSSIARGTSPSGTSPSRRSPGTSVRTRSATPTSRSCSTPTGGRRADTLADKVLDAPETADEVYGVERCDSAQTRYRDTSAMVDRHGDEKHIEFTAAPLYEGDDSSA